MLRKNVVLLFTLLKQNMSISNVNYLILFNLFTYLLSNVMLICSVSSSDERAVHM